MKKITSRETFDFNAGNEVILNISPDGCLATDDVAQMAYARYGGLIQIEEADVQDEVNKITGGDSVAVTDSMGREELEEIATAKGFSKDDIKAAKKKSDLVALINATTAPAPTTVTEAPVVEAPAADATTTAPAASA